MGYANRTAREKRVLSCSACGFEDLEKVILAHYEKLGHRPELAGDSSGATSYQALGNPRVPAFADASEARRSDLPETPRPDRLPVGSGEAVTPTHRSSRSLEKLLLGSALIGVAVGLAVSTLFRKR